MLERTFEIQNRLGIHARPAAQIVKTTSSFRSKITIFKDDTKVNGKSIMGVMMLAAAKGSHLTVRADGEDEEEALEALAALFKSKFGEM